MNEYTIEHIESQKQFVIELDAEHKATLSYSIDENDQSMDIESTFVPDEYRGKSLAGLLVDAALAYAKQAEREIHTSCWYAELRLKRKSA